MIREAYTPRFYTHNSKFINNVLALREPQHQSLEIFARLCDVLSLSKTPDMQLRADVPVVLLCACYRYRQNAPDGSVHCLSGL